MPQMVALLNGFGGAASLLVGGAEFLKSELIGEQIPFDTGVTIQLSLLVGAVTSFAAIAAVMYFTRRIDWYGAAANPAAAKHA